MKEYTNEGAMIQIIKALALGLWGALVMGCVIPEAARYKPPMESRHWWWWWVMRLMDLGDELIN